MSYNYGSCETVLMIVLGMDKPLFDVSSTNIEDYFSAEFPGEDMGTDDYIMALEMIQSLAEQKGTTNLLVLYRELQLIFPCERKDIFTALYMKFFRTELELVARIITGIMIFSPHLDVWDKDTLSSVGNVVLPGFSMQNYMKQYVHDILKKRVESSKVNVILVCRDIDPICAEELERVA